MKEKKIRENVKTIRKSPPYEINHGRHQAANGTLTWLFRFTVARIFRALLQIEYVNRSIRKVEHGKLRRENSMENFISPIAVSFPLRSDAFLLHSDKISNT